MTPTSQLSVSEYQALLKRLLEAVYARGNFPKSQTERNDAWFMEFGDCVFSAMQQPYANETGALQAGVYETARLVSTLPRKEALKQLRKFRRPRLVSNESDNVISNCHAAIAHFGASLIRAAVESLPIDVKNMAYDFRAAESIEERIRIIDMVVEAMRVDVWNNRHPEVASQMREERGEDDGQHVSYDYSPWAVLPHVFGRFPDSPIRPNCLGASILMSAWCELAQVKFMHCRLIEDDSSRHWFEHSALLKRAKAYCDEHGIPLSTDELHRIDQDLQSAEISGSDTYSGPLSEGHGFVVAEIAPGQWWVLDPWLYKCYPINADSCEESDTDGFTSVTPDTASRVLDELGWVHPGLTILGQDSRFQIIWDRLNHDLTLELRAARRLVPVWREAWRDHLDIGAALVLMTYGLHNQRLSEGAFEGVTSGIDFGRRTPGWIRRRGDGFLKAERMLQLMFLRFALKDGITPDSESFSDYVEKVVQLSAKDVHAARRICQTLITSGVLKVLDLGRRQLERTHEDANRRRSPFVSVEYGVPTMQVGLGALVHLMAWDELTQTILKPTDLLRFTSSQFVWYEAVTSWHHRYAQIISEEEGFFVRLIRESEQDTAEPPRPKPGLGYLLLTDRQDWAEVLESSGVHWLSATDLALMRETTRAMLAIAPSMQHRQVRRLLARLEHEHKKYLLQESIHREKERYLG